MAQQMAARLEAVACEIPAKVHEADRLYGSVTVRDIVDALAKQDIKMEKRMVLLKEPIKTVGTFKVPVSASIRKLSLEITVTIVPE